MIASARHRACSAESNMLTASGAGGGEGGRRSMDDGASGKRCGGAPSQAPTSPTPPLSDGDVALRIRPNRHPTQQQQRLSVPNASKLCYAGVPVSYRTLRKCVAEGDHCVLSVVMCQHVPLGASLRKVLLFSPTSPQIQALAEVLPGMGSLTEK